MLRLASLGLGLTLFVSGCGPSEPPSYSWEPALDTPVEGWFLSAWGPDGDIGYLVGGQPGTGTILRREGGAYASVDTGLALPLLHWVWGSSATDVFVAGDDGTILHFDGVSWSLQLTPTAEALWGIWGSGPSDVWAVGGSGLVASSPVVLHYDGAAWTEASVPVLVRANVHAYFKVWGSSADDVYVVGQAGVVLHFDGMGFTELFVGASEDLISVWGTDADHVVAVGGRGNGILARWDGVEWTTVALAPTPGLNGVFMRTPDVVHVGGEEGTYGRVDFATLELVPEPLGTTLDVHALFGDAGGVLTAVGGNFSNPVGPYESLALRRALRADE